MSEIHPFGLLEGHRYMNLTTYRRSGEGVPTPVWFACLGDVLHVFTDIDSGKVKRIRNDPRVTLVPSDLLGRPRDENVEAVARIMDVAEFDAADRSLQKKYGWQYQTFRAVLRLRGKLSSSAFLELRPIPDERETG